MKKNLFKIVGGHQIENISDYILDTLKASDNLGNEKLGISSNTQITIGCDSSTKRRNVNYAITIMFYNDFMKNGAHYVFKRIKIPRDTLMNGEKVSQWEYNIDRLSYNKKCTVALDKLIYVRLWNEAEYLMELGMYLDEALKGKYYYKHSKNEYDGTIPTKLPIIHLDMNPNIGNGRNLSNKLYHSAMGMFSGTGFRVVGKPEAFASSSAADLLCK